MELHLLRATLTVRAQTSHTSICQLIHPELCDDYCKQFHLARFAFCKSEAATPSTCVAVSGPLIVYSSSHKAPKLSSLMVVDLGDAYFWVPRHPCHSKP